VRGICDEVKMKSILIIEEIMMKTIKRNTTHAIEGNMMYAVGRN
jgi:hypothetical protein